MARITREKFKVYENVFDNHSMRNLFKLASEGYFEELRSPIQIGKEANVFSAIKADGTFVIVKIYRLMNCNFNKMYDYIRGDQRYIGMKRQKRQVIFSWVQREYRNLLKAREASINAPIPFTFKDNIIVMEYIGDNVADIPALQLKDIKPEDPQKMFDEIIEQMKRLYAVGIVHADLSKFNILVDKNIPYLIDFSQSAPITHNEASTYMKRDIHNICVFFNKFAVKADEDDLYRYITNLKKKL